MPGPKILIVEDEAVVAEDVRTKVEGLRYEVSGVTGSGEEAVKLAETERPDLVLMDIRLEGPIDGLEAAQRIRDRLDIPVVYVTAYADDRTLARAKITEPYGYILKPFRTKDLHSTIETALYKHRMERELEATRRRLAATLDSMADALIAADAGGRVMLINPVAEHLTGWSREEALGRDFEDVFKIINAHTRVPGESMAAEALRSGGAVDMGDHDFLLISKDGREIPIDDSAAPVRDDKGSITGAVLVFRDVTERRRAQEALRESEERLRLLVEHIPALTYTAAIDEASTTAYISPQVGAMLGYSRADYSRDPDLWRKLLHPDDRERVMAEVARCHATGEPFSSEYRMVARDGREVWFHDGAAVVGEGETRQLQGVMVNITERKRAERVMQTQRDLAISLSAVSELDEGLRLCLSAALEASQMDSGGIYLVDESGALDIACHVNLGAEFVDAVSHYDAASANTRVVMAGTPLYTEHARLGVPLSGAERREGLRAIALVPVSDQGRVIACMNAASHTLDQVPRGDRDVLELVAGQIGSAVARLRAEQALRESEERYRQLFDTVSDALMLFDAETREFLDVNRAALSVYGYSKQEFLRLRHADITAEPEDSESTIHEVVDKRVISIPLHPHKKKDGTVFPVEISGSRFRLGGRDVLCDVVRDITERKRAEDEIRRHQLIVESAHDAIFLKDLESRYLVINEKTAEAFGLPREEIIGRNDREIMADQEEAARNIEDDQRVFETGKRTEVTKHMTRSDGERYWFQAVKVPQFDENGDVTGLVGIARDITERERAEEALRESEQRFRLISEQSVMGVGIVQDGVWQYMNEAGAAVFGYSAEEMLSWTPEEVSKIIHPDDRAFVMEQGRKKQAGDKDVRMSYEWRAVTREGEIRWVALYSRTVPFGGRPADLIAFTDVTERKRAEEALRERTEVLETILANIPVMIAFLDEHGHHRWVNRCWQQTLGLSVAETQSHDVLAELYPDPEYRQYVIDHIAAARGAWGDFKTRTRDGRVLDTLWANVPLREGSNIGIGLDITERRRAEEEIAKLAKFPEEDPNAVFRVSGEGIVVYANGPSLPVLGAWDCAVGKPLPEPWRGHVAEAISSGRGRSLEAECGARVFLLTLAPVEGADYVNVYGRDVTERKLAVEGLRESEEWFRNVFEGSRDAIFIIDGEARFVDVNEAGSGLTGYSREEITRMCLRDLPDSGEIGVFEMCFSRVMAGEAVSRETAIRRKDGTRLEAEFSGRRILIRDVPYMHAVVRDITERKRSEKALRASREELRALAGVLQSIREEERTLLARRLHDDIGHMLAAAKMDLSWLSKGLSGETEERTHAEVQQRIESASEQLDSVIQAIRQTAGELRPALLDNFGLVAALEWEAEQLEKRAQIRCTFSSSLAETALERELSISLFRVCEELLTNLVLCQE